MWRNSKRLAMCEVKVKMVATRDVNGKNYGADDLTYHVICIRNVEMPPVKKHAFLLIERSFL